MTTQRQLRRGTTAQVNAMTPAAGELVADTTLNHLCLGDGVTAGGNKFAPLAATSLTASRALASDASGKIAVTAVTSTELGYVSGVTSALQTQLNAKQTLDATLTALAGLSATTGFIAETAADTFAQRTLADNDGITWTNPAGVAGNPTPNISAVKSKWIPATSIRPSATGGCAALADAELGGFQVSTLDFDQTADEVAHFQYAFPNGWDLGAINARFFWLHAAGSAFVARWVLDGAAVSNGDSLGPSITAQAAVNDTGGTINTLYVSDKASLTIAGTPAANDMILFNVTRNGSSGSDTLDADAKLLGVMLYYNTNTLVET